jgi:hypothetical protein
MRVSCEAIRTWCRTFGQKDAPQLRRQRPQPGDTWRRDEVFPTSNGERQSLWHAVDQDGQVLDMLVQPAGEGSRQEVLPQAPPRVPVRAPDDRHRSAQELQRRHVRGVTQSGTLATSLCEPSRRKFPLDDVAAKTASAGGSSCQGAHPASLPRMVQSRRTAARDVTSSRPEDRQERGPRFDTWQDSTSLPTVASK